ncbi:MAG TPA: GNAT family N-acetyltransferase [Bosea sp. (in: a-proteobacteria)]
MALRGAPAGSAGVGTGYAPAPRSDAPITIEARPLAACADIAEAWSQLAGRALEANPFLEPGFALAAAQHLISFRDVVVILAWQGGSGEARRRLVGLIPCCRRSGLFVPDALIGLSDRRVFSGAPLLDRQQAGAVIEAVLNPRSRDVIGGHGLILRSIDLDGELASALRDAAGRSGLTANRRPALVASAAPTLSAQAEAAREALARRGKLTLVEPRTQAGLRDAVEIILAMEASGPRAQAGAATLQDTREVGFLRAMTRGLGRARQCRIGLLMLDDQAVAGAIVLGRGPRGWLYLSAQEEVHARLMPERVLLAMMQEAAPMRLILRPDGLAASGEGRLSLGDLHLSQDIARKPRDLAGRAREVLRGSLFRLPRVRPPRAGAA